MKNNTWAPASYSGIISELAYIFKACMTSLPAVIGISFFARRNGDEFVLWCRELYSLQTA